MRIEIVSGSPRVESLTYRLALFLQKYFTQHTNYEIGLIDVREQPLPMLQHVFTSAQNAPDEFKPLAEKMFKADAFIMVSPEFNGSYTPALKNLFDHFPKQVHKAFGIVTASPGGLGGVRASQQMQLLINALFGIGSPYMLVTPFIDKKFDADGNLIDQAFQGSIDNFVQEFLWLAEKTSA